MDPSSTRFCQGGETPPSVYSARYGTPPPPPPHPRRPYLQFPPPPPYPPPDEQEQHMENSDEETSPPPPYHIQEAHFQRQDSRRAYSPNLSSSLPSHLLHSATKGIEPNYGAHIEDDFRHEANFHQLPSDFERFPDVGHVNPHLHELEMRHNEHHRSSPHSDTYEAEGAEYSYAYYEPGPPTSHANFLVNNGHIPAPSDRSNRHTYVTRYGTEENIYEEISEVAAKCSQLAEQERLHHHHHQRRQNRQNQQSHVSLNQSVLEEEVRRVQSRHRRVLGELNLTVEAMLMPPPPPRDEETTNSNTSSNKGQGPPDLLEDLLLSVGPTDELLSPASCSMSGDHDSGFSGSSGTSYGFSGSSGTGYSGSSLKRHGDKGSRSSQSFPRTLGCGGSAVPSPGYSPLLSRRGGKSGSGYLKFSKSQDSGCKAHQQNKQNQLQQQQQQQQQNQSQHHGFFGRKGWIRLPGFGSGQSSKDEPRMRSGSWDDSGNVVGHVVGNSGTGVSHRRLDQSQRTVSSEESWYSGGSDQDLSSGDESEKSGNSVTNNGQLKTTLHKARTLCDKWRGGGRQPSDPNCTPQAGGDPAGQGRLSRWFSIRRGSANQYDVDNTERSAGSGKMPLLPEVEEESATSFANFSCAFQRRQLPPTLPAPPAGLTSQQLKRRLIVAAIVHSENSYVATLQRLVNDYKKPLEESSPPILSSSKISTLFHRLPEILQCHTLFRIALAESIRNWDRDEKIGDVFVASFSKAIVLDIYSGFINNFSVAMDLAKMEAKRKSALADFLKVKQISAHDRLSFFGLMVKPVQRFPQFILFLQDLLKHTPQGHHDRMSLQLALTQLESLAEMLNERKREAEQFQAFKEMLRHISGKFAARPLSDGNRYLLREDNVTQLEFNQAGLITKSKSRRLLLLNDLVVCVSVAPKASDDFGNSERLSLKWTYPVTDIEVQDTSASPTLSRLLTAGMNRGSSIKSDRSSNSVDLSSNTVGVDNLCAEMNNLMHDFEVVSRIADLVSLLKGSYKELSVEGTRRILNSIQSSIQQKDEEMAWVDSCCLQLAVKNKSNKEEIYTFQTDNPAVKKEWITELRLAQLALDPNNSPAWEVPEQERRPSTKMPLFVKAQSVYKSQHQTEVRCGCFYVASSTKPTRRRSRNNNYLWVCTTDGASSHIAILAQQLQQSGTLKDVGAFDLVETKVTAMEFVRGVSGSAKGLSGDTVWMGTDSRRLLLYAAGEPEKQEEVGSCTVPAVIVQIRCHCDCVFVALANGSLLQYSRNPQDGAWALKDPQTLSLGTDPVSCLLPINMCLYAACGKKVWVLSALTGEIQKNFSVQHEHVGNVNLMAHSGIGLWISLKNSSTICLYHTETFKHLQDINIASNVLRVTSSSNNCSNRDCINNNRASVTVTALMACKGLLWVGTNVGISLTIPLPRLEGVPIISGRVNISYHAHFGPISFLLALQPRGTGVNFHSPKPQEEEVNEDRGKDDEPENQEEAGDDAVTKAKLEKQSSDTSVTSSVAAKLKHQLTSSPVVIRRRRHKESDLMARRASKTLPRGLGCGGGLLSTSTTSSQGSGDTCDVYGLYGELMYVKDYEGEDGALNGGTDPIYESLRRSDPELAAIPGKVSTLDRRLRLKASRPRSLDLSNWSVDSRSSSLYTSSGSEETLPLRNGGGSRSVSRHGSNVSSSAQVANGPSDVTTNLPTESAVTQIESKPTVKGATTPTDSSRRTVITLMGGRGYVNWRQACCYSTDGKNKHFSTSSPEPNSNDAHIVIWEMKL
ncbi:rho guanine nucleotide exchange factor 10-like isoform X2 [Periplaneta americana]|uniref:rho guanine nucleotide exchange factor 10-like isoform X2 n=1 Tax=Periplaneta americana TaxID=6978 RepID=UPI0037E96FE6